MTGTDVSVASGYIHWKPLLGWKRDGASVVESIPGSMSPKSSRIGGSDSSSCTFDGESISTESACEFVIQCANGEMVFVTSTQSKMLRKRSAYFRDALLIGTPEFEDRIVKRPEWSVATTRRLIELLATGTLWLENDVTVFTDLAQAAEKVKVGLRLGSLINYHDTLDEHDTKRFFQMVNIEKYQFKIHVTIKSWQWMDLMKQGILLLLKAKVLMMKIGQNVADSSIVSHKSPTYDRLAKCDSISSEFSVYASGKLNVLLKILEVLSPLTSSNSTPSRSHQQEMCRITYLTKAGELSQDEMNMLWRITSASYTTATDEERKYLDSADLTVVPAVVSHTKSDVVVSSNKKTGKSVATNVSSKPGLSKSVGANNSTASGSKVENKISLLASATSTVSLTNQPPCDFHYRTITCNSFVVLKHIFESINRENNDLPAALIVNAPTPDTLGRLINAGQKCKEGRKELGMDIAENIFFAAKSSGDIKCMLDYLADYSTSAVVKDDFKLAEFQHPVQCKTTKPK